MENRMENGMENGMELSKEKERRRLCTNWFGQHKCRFGDKCKFLHPGSMRDHGVLQRGIGVSTIIQINHKGETDSVLNGFQWRKAGSSTNTNHNVIQTIQNIDEKDDLEFTNTDLETEIVTLEQRILELLHKVAVKQSIIDIKLDRLLACP